MIPGAAYYSTNLTDGANTYGTLSPAGGYANGTPPTAENATLPNGRTNYGFGNGLEVQVIANGSIYINGSRIIQSDILVRNGVVHVIDK